VGNGAIEKWTAAIQKYAEARADEHFNEALVPPYGALLARPIARVNALRKAGTVSHVVIVPDRAMHGLPFAGLKNGDRYLIRDHAVSVVASATLYAFSLSQDDELSKMTADLVFLIGNPTFNATQDVARKLPPLDRAGSEVTRIQKVYEPLIKVEPRVKEKATVHAFFEFAPRSAVVHIAAHGVANSDVPSHSFILLAPGDNGSGALDAERLLKEWHLQKTRLVVLSACSSAGGTPVGPEGLAPLVRPLIAAGVPGVVGTLWNVSNSAATEELVVRFHQHYSEGYDAENALRLAQLDLIRDIDESRHAAWAWAPFQVIGHASSPFNAKQKEQRR
jgi:CHAT domain-containing protein